jgi:hypothetical protein
VSAYIPTNVISITDGQIYLEPDLFYAGVRPAVNVGISVSRVGGNAQTKAMKKVAGKLRLDLAQYRELEAFAQFASDLDAGTKAQLARGERTVEVLKQTTAATWPMEEQVATIYAVGQGLMDDVPVEDIKRFESEMIDALRSMPSEALKAIKETGVLDDDTAAKLKEEISSFKKNLWRKEVAPAAPAASAAAPKAPPAPTAPTEALEEVIEEVEALEAPSKEEGTEGTEAPKASAMEEGTEGTEAPEAPEAAAGEEGTGGAKAPAPEEGKAAAH